MMILARRPEQEQLETLFQGKEPAFLAVYGRRRIGKTYLVQQFFAAKEDCFYVETTGVANATTTEQLQNMALILGEEDRPASWSSAFHTLWSQIDGLPKRKKVVIFLDELPWLASPKSGFLPALDFFWNRLLSRRPNSLLIVCGSAAAWMIRKVINNKAGLHNRVTHRMPMEPFTISETALYLEGRGVSLNRKQVLELYMALGGVALYLNHVAPGQSAAQNIDRICFAPGAFLADEFGRLFRSLFGANGHHVDIIRALAGKKLGLQSEAILTATGLQSGGTFTRVLDELTRSGFVMATAETGKKTKGTRYRLIDEYSLFYLTWIEPRPKNSASQGTWMRLQKSGKHNAWAGYAFENFCFRHIRELVRALKLEVVYDTVSTWSIGRDGDEAGAQIDLVIDRRDNCMNLCEMKFAKAQYAVTPAMAKNLNHKRQRFEAAIKTRKQLFTTLVTTFGAKPNAAYLDAVDQQLSLDDFFE